MEEEKRAGMFACSFFFIFNDALLCSALFVMLCFELLMD